MDAAVHTAHSCYCAASRGWDRCRSGTEHVFLAIGTQKEAGQFEDVRSLADIRIQAAKRGSVDFVPSTRYRSPSSADREMSPLPEVSPTVPDTTSPMSGCSSPSPPPPAGPRVPIVPQEERYNPHLEEEEEGEGEDPAPRPRANTTTAVSTRMRRRRVINHSLVPVVFRYCRFICLQQVTTV